MVTSLVCECVIVHLFVFGCACLSVLRPMANHSGIVENYDTGSICYAESVLSPYKGAIDAVS